MQTRRKARVCWVVKWINHNLTITLLPSALGPFASSFEAVGSALKLFDRFEDICAKFNGHCLQNGFLALKSNIQNILDGKIPLTYPV